MSEVAAVFSIAVIVIALYYAGVYKDRYRRSYARRDLVHLILHWMGVAIGIWGVLAFVTRFFF